jgi:hypothetical protein
VRESNELKISNIIMVHVLLNNTLSRPEKIVLAFSRSVTGSLSVFADACIIFKILMRFRMVRRSNEISGTERTTTTTYHRLLLGMSCLDICHSFWAALSTLPVPASTGVVGGHGTTMTCSVQGFFIQFSAATPVYMASLTTYFMLKIRYNVSEDVLRQRYEFWFHLVPAVIAVGGACVGAGLRIFNPIALPELGCWVAPYPRGCHITGGCTKGYKIGQFTDYYAWLLAFIWFFLSFFVVLVNNGLIYAAIKHQERRNAAYLASRIQSNTLTAQSIVSHTGASSAVVDTKLDESQVISLPGEEVTHDIDLSARSETSTHTRSGRSGRSVKTSRIAAVQCLLYVSTAFFTTTWTVMPWIGKKIGVQSQWRFFFAFMVNIFNPSQGFFTLIIFLRLQYIRLRATEPDWSWFKCIKFCLFSPDIK